MAVDSQWNHRTSGADLKRLVSLAINSPFGSHTGLRPVHLLFFGPFVYHELKEFNPSGILGHTF
ncbi:hypothetical protein Hdeb2414_s0022g00613671 [Helianthus debilis subsp. tardiflorus]